MPHDPYANERRTWRSQKIRRAQPPEQTVPMPPPPPPAARLRAAADLFPEMLKTLTAAAEALAERDAAARTKDEKLRDLLAYAIRRSGEVWEAGQGDDYGDMAKRLAAILDGDS